MLFEQTTESRFALLFVRAKKAKIETVLGIRHLDILVASWVVYIFILKNKSKIQSMFQHPIELYKTDALLPEIITALKKAQKWGVKLQDELPFPAEIIHFVI